MTTHEISSLQSLFSTRRTYQLRPETLPPGAAKVAVSRPSVVMAAIMYGVPMTLLLMLCLVSSLYRKHRFRREVRRAQQAATLEHIFSAIDRTK